MIFKEKALTVEAFQMTKEAYQDQESWPDWVKSAWSLPITDIGSFHCLHHNPARMCFTAKEGTGHIPFGSYLIGPQWRSCCLGVDRVMSKQAFEYKYEEA